MQSRRTFLILSASAGALLAIGAPVLAKGGVQAQHATAITEVFGNGPRLTGVAVEYDSPVTSAELTANDFHVEGRTVTGVFASTSSDPADRTAIGRFVIVTLSPEDTDASLSPKMHGPGGGMKPPGGSGFGKPNSHGAGGMGKAGSRPGGMGMAYRTAEATIGLPDGKTMVTSTVRNLIVDEFQQLEFHDSKTGETLKYNLFVPRHYDPTRSYPLVLFMHDASVTGDRPRATLLQGLGAIAWASPEDQARRPAFVLAPQYAEIIADDDFQTSMLDTTINLVNALAVEYNIDRKRLYTTGQSGGCMMSIAMDIKYPDFFAASFLVAGQWDPALVKLLAGQKLWVLVSQDDNKAFPGQNAIMDVLEKEGAKISRAVWDGTWNAEQFRAAFEKIDAEGSPINYVTFSPGSVIPAGESAAGASGHMNTWRIAYAVEPIREWVFRQHK
ncbi:putative peptidase [Pseudomonas duriflava]|uniref:Putative peptidase n=1 Tax=Pseudomonas duriflava TaxID=459528 RepID=A0A562PXW4_9PSED|nr:peptidase [Pseudomonas duriflava]TWI49259.1 putative peptidase [Pseudomonas duriflava]